MNLVRQLAVDDFEGFYDLRREGLIANPEAFLTTLEQFEQTARDEELARFKRSTLTPDRTIFGAFDGKNLIGMLGLFQLDPPLNQRAFLWGMFTRPDHRGRGVGRRLVVTALEHVDQLLDVTEVALAVLEGNKEVISFYKKYGFDLFKPEAGDPLLEGALANEFHMIYRVNKA